MRLWPVSPCATRISRSSASTAAQMTKTILLLISLAYVIDADPGPVLIVQPPEGDADSFSKERVSPMLRDVPAMAGKVVEFKSHDSGNTILQKRFRGGSVSLTGAVSPRGLRRRSVRYLMCDEIDAYEVTPDGDPIALAAARTSKFWNRKIVMCSTPTMEKPGAGSPLHSQRATSATSTFPVRCAVTCRRWYGAESAGATWRTARSRQKTRTTSAPDAASSFRTIASWRCCAADAGSPPTRPAAIRAFPFRACKRRTGVGAASSPTQSSGSRRRRAIPPACRRLPTTCCASCSGCAAKRRITSG